MRDLAFLAFLAAFLACGLRRPFIFVLAYAYIDIVAPQRLSYFLLNAIPISQIVAGLAIGAWLLIDDKRNFRFAGRQGLLILMLGYFFLTTLSADFPIEAWDKWEWVWKGMFWAIFLPVTLRTRLRIESYLLVMLLSAASIVIVGGIKTAAGGGGYGSLNLMVDNNSGLYEGSQISTVAIAIIPLILWFTRHGTIFHPDWRVKLFSYNFIFACLLIPVGTQARTGLVCIAVLALLMLRDTKRRILYVSGVALALAVAVPFLPSAFSDRMETIQTYQSDQSASTRLAVWAWTWDFAKDHPTGGGFVAYKQNAVRVTTVAVQDNGNITSVNESATLDSARAYHSSYFEMLGEQGFPGLAMFLLLHAVTLLRLEMLRRRYRCAAESQEWIAPLATALQNGQLIYLVGSIFVGIAYQPFIYMLLAVAIGFDSYVTRKARKAAKASRGEISLFAPQSRLASK